LTNNIVVISFVVTTTEPVTFIQLNSERRNSPLHCDVVRGTADVANQAIDYQDFAHQDIALQDRSLNTIRGLNVSGDFADRDVANQDAIVDAVDLSVTSL